MSEELKTLTDALQIERAGLQAEVTRLESLTEEVHNSRYVNGKIRGLELGIEAITNALKSII